jgi:circadian clock protein KaiC
MAGAGKTVLANQIAFSPAGAGDRVVFFTLLVEMHDRMLEFMRSMTFADAGVLADRAVYHSAYGELEERGAEGLLGPTRQTLREFKPSLLVLDGLYVAQERANGARELRRLIYQLQAEAISCD